MANTNVLNVTIACPLHLMEAANQLSLCIGLTEADVDTFGKTIMGDYAVANLRASYAFLGANDYDLAPLAAFKGADLALAQQAQDVLIVWDTTEPPLQPSPDHIAVIVLPAGKDAGKQALSILGLT